MSSEITGVLNKMHAHLNTTTDYFLPIGDENIPLTPLIGKQIRLVHSGNIFCTHCGKKTKKSYSQGHCFVCMKKLASCDMCIMKPETCHFDQGTCREPDWAQDHCMVDHYIYLSNTSSLKVGITRHTQIPTRWIDQGATQGLPIIKVSNRKLSGLIEIELAKHIADKTNWRTLLKGNAKPIDLVAHARELLSLIDEHIIALKQQFGDEAIAILPLPNDTAITELHYPVNQFPVKIISHNFDKEPVVSGELQGIKGQYLIFDTGVINVRKFTAYEVTLTYSI